MTRSAVTFASLFLLAALATANAKTYSVKLFQPTVVAGTELKAGTYGIDLKDSSIVIKDGKNLITVPARLETVATKYPTTTTRCEVSNGKDELLEIRLGDTKLKVVLGSGASNAGAAAGQMVH